MMRLDEPMITLDEDEWRASKAMLRTHHYRRRMATEPPASVRRRMLEWRAAIYRDDLGDPFDLDDRTDPVERELVLEEQAA